MANKELAKSWNRTKAFLLDAEFHLPEDVKKLRADAITEFHKYLGHNELELALASKFP